MPSSRISFEEAISEDRLLRPFMEKQSTAQAAWLKIAYGCALDDSVRDARGWTELDYYYASQGSCAYDDLGYLVSTRALPYTPQEYTEVWGVCGVRAGKTDRLAAPIVAYEAVLGGHEDHTSGDRPIVCFQIAQDIRMAKYSLHSIYSVLKSMKFLRVGEQKGSWITNITADRIELKNNVHIMVTPPTVKSIRGYDSPVAVLDEVGVWYQDADSANPDFEIYDQVNSRQAQFSHPKIVGISSPWNRGGMLFQRYEAGSNGRNIRCEECRKTGRRMADCPSCVRARAPHQGRVILHGTTAVSNPIVSRAWLQSSLNKDPRAFERECLARFQDSLSGFLSSALIEKARARGVTSRPPVKGNFYIAAIDPAFRGDAFGFTIVHCEPEKGIIQDHVDRWYEPHGEPIDPAIVFSEIAKRCRDYGIKTVFTDQYGIEAHQYIAQQHGFSLEEVTFSSESKAEIYGNLQSLLRQGRLVLIDDDVQISELKSIEKKLTQAGKVTIGAPEGMHDDMATVVAIACNEAVWMLPKVQDAEAKPKSIIARHIDQLVKQKARRVRDIADGIDDW